MSLLQTSAQPKAFKDVDAEMGLEIGTISSTQSPVRINYKFYDKSRATDPAVIDIPSELFEGPAQSCLSLFLRDLRVEFSDMDASARQLELWAPNSPLDMKNTIGDAWRDSVVLERDFRKILRPLSLSRQILVKEDNHVHLVVAIRGEWAGNRVVPLSLKIALGPIVGFFVFLALYIMIYMIYHLGDPV